MKNFFLLLLITSSAQVFSQTEFKTQTFKELGFELKVPKTWTVDTMYSENIPIIAIRPPLNETDTSFKENMNVVSENAEGYDLEKYYSANLQMMKSGTLENFKIQSEISGNNFKAMVYAHTMGEFELNVISYFYFHKNKGYVVTCTSVKNEFEKYRKMFETLGKSLVFLGK